MIFTIYFFCSYFFLLEQCNSSLLIRDVGLHTEIFWVQIQVQYKWTIKSEWKSSQKVYQLLEQRRDLLDTINEVFELHNIVNLPNHTLEQIMLYGDRRFSHSRNKQILELTLKFIHATERSCSTSKYKHR